MHFFYCVKIYSSDAVLSVVLCVASSVNLQTLDLCLGTCSAHMQQDNAILSQHSIFSHLLFKHTTNFLFTSTTKPLLSTRPAASGRAVNDSLAQPQHLQSPLLASRRASPLSHPPQHRKEESVHTSCHSFHAVEGPQPTCMQPSDVFSCSTGHNLPHASFP